MPAANEGLLVADSSLEQNEHLFITNIPQKAADVKPIKRYCQAEQTLPCDCVRRYKKDRVVGLGDLQGELNIQTSPVIISITDLLEYVNP